MPVPLEPESPSSIIASAPGRVPSQWTSVPETEEFIRVPLPTSSDEFKLAESLFRQSMSESKAVITSIERVQTPFMWEKYARYGFAFFRTWDFFLLRRLQCVTK